MLEFSQKWQGELAYIFEKATPKLKRDSTSGVTSFFMEEAEEGRKKKI